MRVQAMTAAAIVALTAAACSPKADAPPAEAAAPALTGRAAVYAAGERDAEAFVRALYADVAAPEANLETADGTPPPSPGRDPIYTRRMNALIGADFRREPGKPSHLDYDPLCGCSTVEGLALDRVTMTAQGPKSALAEVSFTNQGKTRRQTLQLTREGPMWRVADILVPGKPPLSETLLKAIA